MDFRQEIHGLCGRTFGEVRQSCIYRLNLTTTSGVGSLLSSWYVFVSLKCLCANSIRWDVSIGAKAAWRIPTCNGTQELVYVHSLHCTMIPTWWTWWMFAVTRIFVKIFKNHQQRTLLLDLLKFGISTTDWGWKDENLVLKFGERCKHLPKFEMKELVRATTAHRLY